MNTSRQPARAATSTVAALALIGAASLLAAATAGCSSKLETGYKPRLLGSSAETRRGFYAQPFTAEAKKAKQYEQDFGTPGGASGARPRPND